MKIKRRGFPVLLAAALAVPWTTQLSTARAQDAPPARVIPFTLSTMGGAWLIQSEFKGQVSVEAGRLSFHFGGGKLALRDGVPADTKRQIVSVVPLLRHKDANGTLAVTGHGTPTPVGRELGTEQAIEVGAFDSTLALDKNIDLSQNFITLEIQMQRKMPDGTTGPSTFYVPSAEDIFVPKP